MYSGYIVKFMEDTEDIDETEGSTCGILDGDPGRESAFEGSWNVGGDDGTPSFPFPFPFAFRKAPSSDMVIDKLRFKSLISSRKDDIVA